jgi:hypothetical protein
MSNHVELASSSTPNIKNEAATSETYDYRPPANGYTLLE